MHLNLNEPIKVKLTDWGKEIFYHQYDNLNAACGREICKPRYPKVDKDGYTMFQLWCFMELYGPHMGMTLPNVIEPLEIVFEDSTIKPKRKSKRKSKRKWIPCRKRLPEEYMSCWCTIRNHYTYDNRLEVYNHIVVYDPNDKEWIDEDMSELPFEVVAWMPVPEHYTESEECENEKM